MHQWMLDSGHTPHLVVDVNIAGVQVPAGYIKDGKLVLNISYDATRGLDLANNEQLEFETRFGGVSRRVFIPMNAVLAIYAQETGEGLVFEPGKEPPPKGKASPTAGTSAKSGAVKKPSLKVVK